MEAINIKFISEDISSNPTKPSYLGIIKIGNFEEKFIAPTSWWSCKDYEKQWKEGLERIYTHDFSCLITVAQLSPKAPLVDRWILYKEHDIVYVQNDLVFGNFYRETFNEEPFNLKTCYKYVEPRELKDENGRGPAEWSFKLKDLNINKALS